MNLVMTDVVFDLETLLTTTIQDLLHTGCFYVIVAFDWLDLTKKSELYYVRDLKCVKSEDYCTKTYTGMKKLQQRYSIRPPIIK